MVDELALVSVLLAAVALISCLSVDNKRAIRRMPRGLWLVAILLVPVVGPVAWFVAGRPLAIRSGAGWRDLRGLRRRPRPVAPDDDTDFLRSLDPEAVDGPDRPPRRDPNTADPDEPEQRHRPDPDPNS